MYHLSESRILKIKGFSGFKAGKREGFSPSGAICANLSESGFSRLKDFQDLRRENGKTTLLAPEGRHVYSRATCALCLNHRLKRIEQIAQIKKRGSHRAVESVGVGSPNSGLRRECSERHPLGAGL